MKTLIHRSMHRLRAAPAWSFFVLATVITWTFLAPIALSAIGSIAWSPPPLWHALGALGPWLAALVVITVCQGTVGRRAWFASQGRWRVGWSWLLLGIFSPLVMLVLALVIGRLVDGAWPNIGRLLDPPYGISWMVSSFVIALAYGFGEEAGWRGFLLPQLSQRRSVVGTILLLTLAWGSWHGIMFAYRLPTAPVLMIGFFVGLLAGAIWLSWLYYRTRSVLVVASWHAVWNMVNIPAMALSDTVLAALSTQVMILAICLSVGWWWQARQTGYRGWQSPFDALMMER